MDVHKKKHHVFKLNCVRMVKNVLLDPILPTMKKRRISEVRTSETKFPK